MMMMNINSISYFKFLFTLNYGIQFSIFGQKKLSTKFIGIVLWHINPCWLFNTESNLYRYQIYIVMWCPIEKIEI